jgi:hypothetical protein
LFCDTKLNMNYALYVKFMVIIISLSKFALGRSASMHRQKDSAIKLMDAKHLMRSFLRRKSASATDWDHGEVCETSSARLSKFAFASTFCSEINVRDCWPLKKMQILNELDFSCEINLCLRYHENKKKTFTLKRDRFYF